MTQYDTAGDVKIGSNDYYVYSNSLVDNMEQLETFRSRRRNLLGFGERLGKPRTRIKSSTTSCGWMVRGPVYVPIMKQGGDTNTIDVVNGVRGADWTTLRHPEAMVANVVFDQSVYREGGLQDCAHEGSSVWFSPA